MQFSMNGSFALRNGIARTGLAVCLGCLGLASLPTTVAAFRMEVGEELAPEPNINSGAPWESIAFAEEFSVKPVVIATANFSSGSESYKMSVRNVTTTGFEYNITEGPGTDGGHTDGFFSWLALEPGTYVLEDGTLVSAGRVSTTAATFSPDPESNSQSEAISFLRDFAAKPAVFATMQTVANAEAIAVRAENPLPLAPAGRLLPWMVASVTDVTTSGFALSLDQGEATSEVPTLAEEVGYLAIDVDAEGSFPLGADSSVGFQSFHETALAEGYEDGCNQDVQIDFGQTYPEVPAVLAQITSRNDGDGGWAYVCNSASRDSLAQVVVNEDVALTGRSQDIDGDDPDAGIVPEDVSLLVMLAGNYEVVATMLPSCGDGLLDSGGDSGESCDDGNASDGDGCSASCEVEPGYACATPGEACAPVCGDGQLSGGEACDDGNTAGSDGCAADCSLVEEGFTCPTPGQLCTTGDGVVDDTLPGSDLGSGDGSGAGDLEDGTFDAVDGTSGGGGCQVATGAAPLTGLSVFVMMALAGLRLRRRRLL